MNTIQDEKIIAKMKKINKQIEELVFPLTKDRVIYFLNMIYGILCSLLYDIPMDVPRMQKVKELADYLFVQMKSDIPIEKIYMIIGNIQSKVGNGLSHNEPINLPLPQKEEELNKPKPKRKYTKRAKTENSIKQSTKPVKILEIPESPKEVKTEPKKTTIEPKHEEKEPIPQLTMANTHNPTKILSKPPPKFISRKVKEERERSRTVVATESKRIQLCSNNDTDFVARSNDRIDSIYRKQEPHVDNTTIKQSIKEPVPTLSNPVINTTKQIIPEKPKEVIKETATVDEENKSFQKVKSEQKSIKWYMEAIILELKTTREGLLLKDLMQLFEKYSRNSVSDALFLLIQRKVVEEVPYYNKQMKLYRLIRK